MCNPGILIAAATAVSAVGTGVSAIQNAAMQRYQARVADQNASLASEQARDAQDRTQLEAQRQYRQIGATKGQQIAAMAANGIDVNSGSALQVQQDTAMIGSEDVGQIYKQGDQDVRGFDISASNYRAQAAASRQASTNSLVSGAFDVGSTVLGGAKQYAGYKKTGKFG